MIVALGKRLLCEPAPRALRLFLHNFVWKGGRGLRQHRRRLRRGQVFPPFLFVSVTNACNLTCQGCWAAPTDPPRSLRPEDLDRIVAAGKSQSCFFYGILGGEPLLHEGLLDFFGRHRDCYFQLFTNGTLLTEPIARELRQLGNVTPVISIEGTATTSDERRGGNNVYERSLRGLAYCRQERLIFGVATSLCQSNLDTLATESYLHSLVELGALYAWYYLYRPVGPNPCPELALRPEQISEFRRFLVSSRCRVPIVIVDAYWDHAGRAICPAAAGLSHHIAPNGAIEPCPVIQFACDHVQEGADLVTVLEDSVFLREFRQWAAARTPGCVLLECPQELRLFLEGAGAMASSGRDAGFAELQAMGAGRTSHHLPGQEIPEQHWAYRIAKRMSFFGFGAYG